MLQENSLVNVDLAAKYLVLKEIGPLISASSLIQTFCTVTAKNEDSWVCFIRNEEKERERGELFS